MQRNGHLAFALRLCGLAGHLRRAPRKERRLESPEDFLAHRHAPGRRLSRRSLLGWSAAGALAAAAGLFTARTAHDEMPPAAASCSRTSSPGTR